MKEFQFDNVAGWFLVILENLMLQEVTQLAFTCSNSTIETIEKGVKYIQRQWDRLGVFIVNFEHISHLVLVFLLLTLSR